MYHYIRIILLLVIAQVLFTSSYCKDKTDHAVEQSNIRLLDTVQLQNTVDKIKRINFFLSSPHDPCPSRKDTDKLEYEVGDAVAQLEGNWLEILKSLRKRYDELEDKSNSDDKIVSVRKDKYEALLLLRQTSNSLINPDFVKKPFMMNVTPEPDRSDKTGQFFLPNMPAEDIKHPKTRENYEKTVWDNAKNIFEYNIQRGASGLFSRVQWNLYEDMLRDYALEPRADQELVDLLEKYEYPFVERCQLLSELKIPYKDFRIWESTDTLFRATAKFISWEQEGVTLEKADGKRTTIEFDVLRAEDQEFVQQLPPVFRTWTSTGGTFTIEAKYVSSTDKIVMLERKDGAILEVILAEVSQGDREYVRRQQENEVKE